MKRRDKPKSEREGSRDALVAVGRQLVRPDVVVAEAEELLGRIGVVLAFSEQHQPVSAERRRDQDRVEMVLTLQGGACGEVERQVKRRHVAVRELDAAIRALFRAVADLGKNRPVPRCRRLASRFGRGLGLLTAACRLARRLTSRLGGRLFLVPAARRLACPLTSLRFLCCRFRFLCTLRLDDLEDASLARDRILLGLRRNDPQQEQHAADN